MQEKLTDNPTPTSSRASSFFIDNILGNARNGHGSMSNSGRGIPGVEAVSIGRVTNAHRADTSAPAPDGSSSAVRESLMQWNRGGTDSNFRALETPQSEYGPTMRSENRSLCNRRANQRLATNSTVCIFVSTQAQILCCRDHCCIAWLHAVYNIFFCQQNIGSINRELSHESWRVLVGFSVTFM